MNFLFTEIKDLKAENKRLLEKIQNMQNERLDLGAEVRKLEDDLAETYKNYRDELDSKKLLLQEMNDMRDQKDDLMASKEAAEMEAQDDPVTLKIALRYLGNYLGTIPVSLRSVITYIKDTSSILKRL